MVFAPTEMRLFLPKVEIACAYFPASGKNELESGFHKQRGISSAAC